MALADQPAYKREGRKPTPAEVLKSVTRRFGLTETDLRELRINGPSLAPREADAD